MKQEKIPYQTLTNIIKSELTDYYNMTMDVDYGDEFFNALFYGTLKTFVERVDSSGFCQTSYGEKNDVKAYGVTHYSRDSAEAAIVLANCGFANIAESIIAFTLENIPEGQYYIPHVYLRDGSIKANTIQVDTPGHVARALARCIELKGATEKLKALFDELDFIFLKTWEHHFHKDLKLLDAGNYNEQGFGGSNDLLADIFTNTSFMNGAEKMRNISLILGLKNKVSQYDEFADLLKEGMENTLLDKEKSMYAIAYDIREKKKIENINWLGIYSQRWYKQNKDAWDQAFKYLDKSSSIDWDGMSIITCEPLDLQFRILGKVFAHLLAYMKESGRFARLEEHLDFAKKTIRKPSNVFPEWWYHHTPEKQSEYWKGYWKKFKGIWDSYENNPDADYTIDSGNCEQCAVFLNHQLQDIIGVSPGTDGKIIFYPGLPFNFKTYSASRVPVRKKGGEMLELSFKLERNSSETICKVNTNQECVIECSLPIPVESEIKEVLVNDNEVEEYSEKVINDVNFINFSLTGHKNNLEVRY